jgi:hypothetical protein
MNKVQINWLKIELISLYLSIVLFLTFQCISVAYPNLLSKFPKQTPSLFFGFSILVFTHYLTKKIDDRRSDEFYITHPSFSEAIQKLLEPYDYVKNLNVVALSSHSFFVHLRLQPKKIGQLRLLLLLDEEHNELFKNSVTSTSPSTELQETLNGWKLLVADKKIKRIEVRQLKLNASFYFSIVNKENMLWGLFWPRPNFKGVTPRKVFTLSSQNKQSRELIDQATSWFESIWEAATVVQKITGKKPEGDA